MLLALSNKAIYRNSIELISVKWVRLAFFLCIQYCTTVHVRKNRRQCVQRRLKEKLTMIDNHKNDNGVSG